MPRPILGTPKSSKSDISISTSGIAPKSSLQGPQLHERLRQTRSKAYMDAIKRLDAGTHHADKAALDALIAAIANEFPELGIEQRPLGIVSECYLGAPFEVHICDLGGGIIEHFETFRTMPPLFERARTLALHRTYAFIEIYADTLRAISIDGKVSVVEK